jgi:hypothetical protein
MNEPSLRLLAVIGLIAVAGFFTWQFGVPFARRRLTRYRSERDARVNDRRRPKRQEYR